LCVVFPKSNNDVSKLLKYANSNNLKVIPQGGNTSLVAGSSPTENEKEILMKVTQARAGIVNAETPDDMNMFGKEINTAINLAFEAYPQIKSTENFGALQAQLEGTENRINKARTDYNGAVKRYNTHIRGFYNRFILSFFSEKFNRKEVFKAIEGSDVAPVVSFE